MPSHPDIYVGPAGLNTGQLIAYIPAFGEIYLTASAPTSPPQYPTFIKAQGTTTAGPVLSFAQTANNRLQCQTPIPKTYLVTASTTSALSRGPESAYLAIAKNGTVVAKSTIERLFSGATDRGALSTSIVLPLVAPDYIELFCSRALAVPPATLTILMMNLNAVAVN